MPPSHAGPDFYRIRPQRVSILVGPNGSGKSRFLRSFALGGRYRSEIAVISNTVHDRFAGLRGFHRLSAARGGQPATVIKAAAARALEDTDSRLSSVSSILAYCDYGPRLGFQVTRPERWFRDERLEEQQRHNLDFAAGRDFIQSTRSDQAVWIDQEVTKFEQSVNRDFASVLRNESLLRRTGYLERINVYLERRNGMVIPLADASSGELSLISSLIFIASLPLNTRVLLIDEPENSLHPRWQREYVDLLSAAVGYSERMVVIATHAPILVTGALNQGRSEVDVFRVQPHEQLTPLVFDWSTPSQNIEQILWEAFEVITPANHFVSEQMVDVVNLVNSGDITAATAHRRVADMRAVSFDDRQKRFFAAIDGLIDEVEADRIAPDKSDD